MISLAGRTHCWMPLVLAFCCSTGARGATWTGRWKAVALNFGPSRPPSRARLQSRSSPRRRGREPQGQMLPNSQSTPSTGWGVVAAHQLRRPKLQGKGDDQAWKRGRKGSSHPPPVSRVQTRTPTVQPPIDARHAQNNQIRSRSDFCCIRQRQRSADTGPCPSTDQQQRWIVQCCLDGAPIQGHFLLHSRG